VEVAKALSRASDRGRVAELRTLHELFLAGELDPSYLDSARIRPVVAESPRRSLATGVDPDCDAAPDSPVTASIAHCTTAPRSGRWAVHRPAARVAVIRVEEHEWSHSR
jgi:hypothetical protein